MKSQYQKQFLSQQKIQQKVLKALVQKKYEIRVNFSQSKAFMLLQNEIKNQSDQKLLDQMQRNRQNNTLDMKAIQEDKCFRTLNPNFKQRGTSNDNLLEIIKRQNNKLAPMGWYQQKQFSRSKQKSRTYRRKLSINKCRQIHKTLQIRKKVSQIERNPAPQQLPRSHSPFSYSQRSLENNHIWINDALQNVIRTENLHRNKNNVNRPFIQTKMFSKRFNSVKSPELIREKLSTINQYHQNNQNKMKSQDKSQFEFQNNQTINFLQLKKPAFSTMRKKLTSMCQVRNKLQKSRASEILPKQIMVASESCRPWTSRNLQQKGEEAKQAQLLQ